MTGRSALARGAAVVAAFAVPFAVGNALGEDERPAPRQSAAAAREVAGLGPLRLEPAPAIPDLRSVPIWRVPQRASTGPGAASPVAATPKAASPEQGASPAPSSPPPPSAPAPTYTPPPSTAPAPAAPPPSTPPPASETPAPPAAGPDPAPAPAPAPTPDPPPLGGSGQYTGP